MISAFGWDRMLSSQIETQNDRNSLLKAEITRLEKQVAEIKELKKLKADIEKLRKTL